MGQKRLPTLNLMLARKLLLAQNLLLAQKLMPAAKSLLALKKSEFYFIFYQFNRTRIWKRCIPLHPELFYYTFYLSNGPKIDTSSKFAASTKIAAGTKIAASTKNGARNKNAASIKIVWIKMDSSLSHWVCVCVGGVLNAFYWYQIFVKSHS